MLRRAVVVLLGIVCFVIGYRMFHQDDMGDQLSLGLALMGAGLFLVFKSILGGVRLR